MKRFIEGLYKNVAETSDKHSHAELRSKYYKGTKKQVMEAITEALKLSVWDVVHIDQERGEVVVLRKSPILKRKSDIVITLHSTSPVKWGVDVRSASRSGLGDLGVNRHYIVHFYHLLSKKLELITK